MEEQNHTKGDIASFKRLKREGAHLLETVFFIKMTE